MSNEQIKELAKTFINEQKRVLEEYGDSVVRSKYKEAVQGAQRTFQMINKASRAKADEQIKTRTR